MNYTETYLHLTSMGIDNDFFLKNGVKICFEQFKSKPYWEIYKSDSTVFPKEVFNGYNSLSGKNLNFRFPVISPVEKQPHGVIIMLHGLNERNWNKYYPWAMALAKNTKKHIILFPISFHMNRAPESWGDPRQMEPYVNARQKYIPWVKNSSVANIALSERLTIDPEQFFLSGYQSASEIQQLIESIHDGKLNSVNRQRKIDFFGYSIGAFLAEIIALATPSCILDDSDFFFFCGGCTFDKFQASSRYILDSEAFKKIRRFYTHDIENIIKRKSLFSELVTTTRFGEAFMTMLTARKLRKKIQTLNPGLKNHITAIGLKKDTVIPHSDLKKSLSGAEVEVMDFQYEYSHEMPFPVFKSDKHLLVDEAFNFIFNKASEKLKKTEELVYS
jgi:predicted esterase